MSLHEGVEFLKGRVTEERLKLSNVVADDLILFLKQLFHFGRLNLIKWSIRILRAERSDQRLHLGNNLCDGAIAIKGDLCHLIGLSVCKSRPFLLVMAKRGAVLSERGVMGGSRLETLQVHKENSIYGVIRHGLAAGRWARAWLAAGRLGRILSGLGLPRLRGADQYNDKTH